MSDPFRSTQFPRGALIGAAVMIVIAIGAASAGRLGLLAVDDGYDGQAVASRDLRFEDRADGSVAVVDVSAGQSIEVLTPGSDGFMRATLRGLARDRRSLGIGAEPPFRLTLWEDGRLSLEDPSTGRNVALEAFGATNAQAFARLLTAGEGVQ